MTDEIPQQDSGDAIEIEAVPQQTSSDAKEAVPQIVLTGNLYSKIRGYVLPSLLVLGLTGVGYIASRGFQTPQTSTTVEKPISSKTLEENVDGKTNSYPYVTINDTHFMIDERLGKNLNELERESNELSEKDYEAGKTKITDRYDKMKEKAGGEAKKAWGLEEQVKKPEEKKKETTPHENIKKLNSNYDAILNFGKKKK